MAGVKVTDLPVLATVAPADVLYIVDTSDNLSKQIAVEDFLGYKVYTALLTQVDDNAPTAIELENTLGATISYARDGSGSYNCFASSEIFTDKTVVIMPNSLSSSVYANGLITVYTNLFENQNIFYFSTYDMVSETYSDDILLRTPIEIRVYN